MIVKKCDALTSIDEVAVEAVGMELFGNGLGGGHQSLSHDLTTIHSITFLPTRDQMGRAVKIFDMHIQSERRFVIEP